MRDMTTTSGCEAYIELVGAPSMLTVSTYVNAMWQAGGMPKALPVIDMTAPVCCAPVASGSMSDADALQIAVRLKTLADPVRVKIVSYLFSSTAGEEISGVLAAVLDLSESTVGHYLTQLRKAGLVTSDRRGMNVFHRVRPEALQALRTTLDPNSCT